MTEHQFECSFFPSFEGEPKKKISSKWIYHRIVALVCMHSKQINNKVGTAFWYVYFVLITLWRIAWYSNIEWEKIHTSTHKISISNLINDHFNGRTALQMVVYVPFCGILFACTQTDKLWICLKCHFTSQWKNRFGLDWSFFLFILMQWRITFNHLFIFINIIHYRHSEKELKIGPKQRKNNDRLFVLPKKGEEEEGTSNLLFSHAKKLRSSTHFEMFKYITVKWKCNAIKLNVKSRLDACTL